MDKVNETTVETTLNIDFEKLCQTISESVPEPMQWNDSLLGSRCHCRDKDLSVDFQPFPLYTEINLDSINLLMILCILDDEIFKENVMLRNIILELFHNL